MKSPVELEIDLNLDGWHQGYARVPHSVHRSAYGFIPVPIISIKNGEGPVVLLMAGNHGDEYEGQITLGKLARTLAVEQIRGQIIILPMANFPAAQAGLRTSPIDQGNLNRAFPGDPKGTPTEIIAHFIESELLARADYLLDIHSGGSSLYYHPTAMLSRSNNAEEQEKRLGLLNAIGMPKSLIHDSDIRGGYSSSAAARQNAIGMLLEIGGGGRITPSFLPQLETGIARYLDYVCITQTNVESGDSPTRLYEMPTMNYYLHARSHGLFQPEVEIDQEINAGQLAGWIHHLDDPAKQPEKILFCHSATVIAFRVPALVQPGDCLFETAVEISNA